MTERALNRPMQAGKTSTTMNCKLDPTSSDSFGGSPCDVEPPAVDEPEHMGNKSFSAQFSMWEFDYRDAELACTEGVQGEGIYGGESKTHEPAPLPIHPLKRPAAAFADIVLPPSPTLSMQSTPSPWECFETPRQRLDRLMQQRSEAHRRRETLQLSPSAGSRHATHPAERRTHLPGSLAAQRPPAAVAATSAPSSDVDSLAATMWTQRM